MAQDKRLETVLKLMEERGGISMTKDTDKQLSKDIERAENLGYIKRKINRKTGLPGYSFQYTEKGQKLVDSGYNFSVVDDRQGMHVTGTNVHVGDNSGSYSQNNSNHSSSKDSILKKIIVGVIIAVVAGLIIYFLTN